MAAKKPPTAHEVSANLRAVGGWLDDGDVATPARPELAAAVRSSARYLAAKFPGGSVEVRVPPYVAVQLIEGMNHRRGTPPNVIETDPRTWLQLVTGRLSWADAVAAGVLRTSGVRADLTSVLPFEEPAPLT